MEKRKEAGCALAASLLAGALALPTAALEVSQAWGVEPEAAKDEVVYVKAGADGATQGLYVVNVFDTGSVQTVDDPARYTRVKNLTTTDALVQENGAVQVLSLIHICPGGRELLLGVRAELHRHVAAHVRARAQLHGERADACLLYTSRLPAPVPNGLRPMPPTCATI